MEIIASKGSILGGIQQATPSQMPVRRRRTHFPATVAIKDIWLYPLRQNFRATLCQLVTAYRRVHRIFALR